MKKILSILGTISLSTIISTNIIACNATNENNKPNQPIKSQFIQQQQPTNSNGKHIFRTQAPNKEFLTPTNKGYFYISKYYNEYITRKIYFDNNFMTNQNTHGQHLKNDSNFIGNYNSVYRGDGINEPTIPTINNNTGEITNGNEKIES